MRSIKVDVDTRLVELARGATGSKSNSAVIDVALRRLIASKQKGAMISGIAELSDLEAQLGAAVVVPDE